MAHRGGLSLLRLAEIEEALLRGLTIVPLTRSEIIWDLGQKRDDVYLRRAIRHLQRLRRIRVIGRMPEEGEIFALADWRPEKVEKEPEMTREERFTSCDYDRLYSNPDPI